jgi:hypothetical protein
MESRSYQNIYYTLVYRGLQGGFCQESLEIKGNFAQMEQNERKGP